MKKARKYRFIFFFFSFTILLFFYKFVSSKISFKLIINNIKNYMIFIFEKNKDYFEIIESYLII